MRDAGLEEAVRAVGGVSELARQIGISQPSVSNWSRIPAERVLIVEAATGIDRKVLRPDLYGEPEQSQQEPDDVAAARAQEYALLANLLVRAPDAKLLEGLAGLRGDATPLGVSHAALAQAASETTVERAEREFFNLFIGLGRGELPPGYDVKKLLAQIFGDSEKPADVDAAIDGPAGPQAATVTQENAASVPVAASAPGTEGQTEIEAPDIPGDEHKVANVDFVQRDNNIATHNSNFDDETEEPQIRRQHGGALPQ